VQGRFKNEGELTEPSFSICSCRSHFYGARASRERQLTYLNTLVAVEEILGSLATFSSSLVSFSLSAQKSRVDLMSLLQV
jgi:hypothetical protein